ncbi:PTS fructose transporter subunit IIC [Salibacterium salarium]|uniref:PTS fructose transporter subunit IIC n=1 Tax=Salibacterium salarium TaxID=284579 RepID=A0A3R9RDL7_9BACI|nr:PTS fructose transporter subunit IIBC [Salibacterium salarium]RSL33101.1 PTS fructose transporter subunit IIC [Salibacterium salarium]
MSKIKIVAATGCPTGIAHTFMAEESLKKAAQELDVEIKVETHGQAGANNELTSEEIQEADGVIIAADKNVNAYRFDGKPVISVSVGKGIKDAKALINTIIEGEASIQNSNGGNDTTDTEKVAKDTNQGGSISHTIYKHLMNGVSHMLPFVVGGGILTAISFLFGIYSADPEHETYNPVAEFLNNVGGLGFEIMVPVLAAFIAESIAKRPGMVAGFIGGLIASDGGAGFLGAIVAGFAAGYIIYGLSNLLEKIPQSLSGFKTIFLYPVLGFLITGALMTILVGPMSIINNSLQSFLSSFQDGNPILLGVIVGAMCAFDMGGPVNKAAYVTGTALLTEGNMYFMAGVSAACIAPPLITAFATVFFRKYFDRSERNAGSVNFILGSTHITEGAIPFAAKNPIVVIPILMFGSSIAAVITYVIGIEVPAPHGGFLVLPVVTGAIQWVFAILTGSIIGALCYGWYRRLAFKKTNNDMYQSTNGENADDTQKLA